MTEENSDHELTLQLLVPSKKQVIVGRTGLPFRVSFLDPCGSPVHSSDADSVNGLKKRNSELSVRGHKNDPDSAFPRNNEVELGIADSHSAVDVLGSFVDEGPAVQGSFV